MDNPHLSSHASDRRHALWSAVTGWAKSLSQPPFEDRSRRVPQTTRPEDFGNTLRPGEQLRYEVKFAGNPTGLAEARVVGIEPDPRGRPPAGAPTVRIEAHAATSGIVSLVATVTDHVVSHLDARTGAPVRNENVLDYSGWAPRSYKRRVTTTTYEGRGFARVVDAKDGKPKNKTKRMPVDTFDSMGIMAWVRSLDLEKGETAKAHALDGTTLLRIEVEAKGLGRVDDMPSIGRALDVDPSRVAILHGKVTRVDEYDQAIVGKKVHRLRAYLTADGRRIPLVIESDMWVGELRLELTGYDPPRTSK